MPQDIDCHNPPTEEAPGDSLIIKTPLELYRLHEYTNAKDSSREERGVASYYLDAYRSTHFFPHVLMNCEYWARSDTFGAILNRNFVKIGGLN